VTEDIAAVPAAESQGYGDAVTDEEFAEWVKRSQADTDAAIADWDSSVEFDQIRNLTVDGDEMIDAQVFNEDGTVATVEEVNESMARAMNDPRRRVGWSSMAERIRAGEELGPDDRARVLSEMRTRNAQFMASQSPIGSPWSRPVPPYRVIGDQRLAAYDPLPVVGADLYIGECENPACVCHDMALRSGLPGGFSNVLADEARRIRAQAEARRNLASVGFLVVDTDAQPRSSGLVLPGDEAVAWAKRTFGVNG
jgi:hypothetical protein